MTVHVNPETGEASTCRARQGKCPFGAEAHFDTTEAAHQYAEQIMEAEHGGTATVKKPVEKKTPAQKPPAKKKRAPLTDEEKEARKQAAAERRRQRAAERKAIREEEQRQAQLVNERHKQWVERFERAQRDLQRADHQQHTTQEYAQMTPGERRAAERRDQEFRKFILAEAERRDAEEAKRHIAMQDREKKQEGFWDLLFKP